MRCPIPASIMRSVAAASILVALCSCDKQPGSALGLAVAGPTKADAQTKIVDILSHYPTPVIALGEVGRPQDCQAGMVGQGQVQACKVCLVVIEVVPQEDNLGTHGVNAIVAKRVMADVAFKNAISYAQPDIAPTGSGGVWVPAFPVQSPLVPQQPLSFAPISTHVLTPADFAKIGLSMGYYQGQLGVWNGNNHYYWPSDVINVIQKYPLGQMVNPLVGTCA